ncbi:leucyl/phenylalanyl-tRNA--protein transferase [Pelagicoccus sp. NFK12]|uniref:Leucyl/phenylalanyl-tRNA--protein transferase n=1 Tax=Pelagicoccus enzymogenes TaxID=2773457 RepID=A0A927IHG2_9BACT|nr:leucyl/phenylalanyl-tRNA--protein transferase [Pelagicoccus enzymogenes]MBD5780151.1 leucyl/phenylalanyl-tRNA--protein transferase [Pelagicoccus enzymogenes]MDQ8199138.1 leucyl/phenylalanyl-tRNA--protein transferase [Pelagicoccus enzymogenes]
MPIFRLREDPIFPDPELAEEEGIIAIGGDLSPERLVAAYSCGIFPWYSEGDPILWFSPDPRMVLYPQNFKRSKTLSRLVRSGKYELRIDHDFPSVIANCAKIPRPGQDGTWITGDMQEAYVRLHHLGLAHSFETYQEGKLVGGLYGVSLGNAFFGESMFHHARDASKFAFHALVEFALENRFDFIDAQQPTKHLRSLGAQEVPRSAFLKELAASQRHPTLQSRWVTARS